MVLNKSAVITFTATAAGFFGILAYNKITSRRSSTELEDVASQSEHTVVSLNGCKS